MSVASIKQDGEFLGKPALFCLDFQYGLGFIWSDIGYGYFKLLGFFLDAFRQDADASVDGVCKWTGCLGVVYIIKGYYDDARTVWLVPEFLVYICLLDFPARCGDSDDVYGFLSRMECEPKDGDAVFAFDDFLTDGNHWIDAFFEFFVKPVTGEGYCNDGSSDFYQVNEVDVHGIRFCVWIVG